MKASAPRAVGSGTARGAPLAVCALALLGALVFTSAAAQEAGDRGQAVEGASPGPAARPEAGKYGRVGFAHVEGVIDRLRKRYFDRAIERAREETLDTLVVHIDTDGGAVFEARDMLRRALEQANGGPRLVAFVDFRAISAGAMIAYGHDDVYITKTASIGDIGVVFRGQDGEIKYAPEKIETVVRTLLTQASEVRGWPKGLLLKMTARNQTLYRVTLPDGTVEYVIEDEFPDFLARHPDVDREDTAQVIEYRGEDRLLTLTGNEAVRLGMATGHAESLDALYAQLGIDTAAVVDLSPTPTENVASRLSLIAPLLAGLALMFIVFELKTPGVGLWAALAGICGALFLVSQYFLDLANNFEVVLIGVGLVLVAVEVMTMIGGGLIALAGALTLFTGLVLAFLPNEFEFDFTNPRFLEALGSASVSGVVSLGVMAVGIVAFIYALPRSGFAHRMAVTSEVTATSAGAERDGEQDLVGRTGTVRQDLRPGGIVDIGGEAFSAVAEHGRSIAKGRAVRVLGKRFGDLVVEADADAPESGSESAVR